MHGAASVATESAAPPGEGAVVPRGADPAASAVQRLFLEHGAFVLRTVRHFGVPSADLEDATQEVFVVAHRRLGQLDPAADPRSWLYGIARRVAAASRRRAHVRREELSDDPGRSTGASGGQDQRVELRERRAILRAALDALDEDKRAVFVLYELEGLQMPEIAAMEGCPLQTAYSRLRAARQIVQRFVDEAVRGRVP